MPISVTPTDTRALEITLVTDRRRSGSRLTEIVRAAAEAGVDYVQVREKDLPAADLLALVRELRDVLAGRAARLLVNGRLDVALAAGADGVQLPENGLSVAAVRREFPQLVIGASCHSLESAARAEAAGASFVVFGPVFASPGKEDRATGPQPLTAVARRLRIPVHAVGGIDATQAPLLVGTGVRGVAAIRLFLETPTERLAAALAALRAPSLPRTLGG
jgi:thiamine-phosphate pyrophosphorylase